MSGSSGLRLELRATCDENGTDETDSSESWRSGRSPGRTIALGGSTFDSLALDVSYSPSVVTCDPSLSRKLSNIWQIPGFEENLPRQCTTKFGFYNEEELWEDVGVVDYIERKLGTPDESTPEQREEALREVLADTDIHEGDGDLSDFLFHVARTKHGKIYIRVIRTLLLNRGKFFFFFFFFFFRSYVSNKKNSIFYRAFIFSCLDPRNTLNHPVSATLVPFIV